jgi:hypothetical protein
MIAVLSTLLMSAAHAIRGSGHQWLRYVIAAYVLAVTYVIAGRWPPALMAACAILIYLVQPWGRWYTLGRASRALAGPPDDYEKTVEDLCGRSDHACLLLSSMTFSIPLLLMSPWWAALPVGMVLAYELAWRITARFPRIPPIRTGELMTGALIGLCAVLLAGCAKPRDPWADYSRAVGEITRR